MKSVAEMVTKNNYVEEGVYTLCPFTILQKKLYIGIRELPNGEPIRNCSLERFYMPLPSPFLSHFTNGTEILYWKGGVDRLSLTGSWMPRAGSLRASVPFVAD